MTDPILLDLPEQIETERLILRPPRAGEGPLIHQAVAESLPELRQFLASLPWVAADPTAESSEAFCRNAQSNFLARKDLPFFIFEKATMQLLGSTGLHRTVWTTPKTEVGYWIRSGQARKGFVSEAVDALVEFAFSTLGMVRVELITDEDNAASRRTALRCRFELEGILRQERKAPDGTLRNTCVYARLRPSP